MKNSIEEKRLFVPKVSWLAILLLQVLIIMWTYRVVYVVPTPISVDAEPPLSWIRLFQYACGTGIALMALTFPKRVLNTLSGKISLTTGIFSIVLRLAAATGITMFGYVTSFYYSNMLESIPFVLVSAFIMATSIPSPNLMKRFFGDRYQPPTE